jgi:hypothetical protein
MLADAPKRNDGTERGEQRALDWDAWSRLREELVVNGVLTSADLPRSRSGWVWVMTSTWVGSDTGCGSVWRFNKPCPLGNVAQSVLILESGARINLGSGPEGLSLAHGKTSGLSFGRIGVRLEVRSSFSVNDWLMHGFTEKTPECCREWDCIW